MLCRDCPQYEHCTELCMDAEIFVNQDYVPLFEKLLKNGDSTQKAVQSPWMPRPDITRPMR